MTSGSVSSNVKFSFYGGLFLDTLSLSSHLSPAQLHNPSNNDDKEGKELGVGENVLKRSQCMFCKMGDYLPGWWWPT